MRMRRVSVGMTWEGLESILEEMLELVRNRDSLEGSVEYLLPDPDDPPDAEVMVRASYRTGNRMGQGGMSMIGQWGEVVDGSPKRQ